MTIRLYVLEDDAQGCKLLCIKADLWPAISGILSDNMWQFDDATKERVKEVLAAMDCCETFEQCDLVTNADLNEALSAVLDLIREGSDLEQIPFLPMEGEPELWPPVPTVPQQQCDVANAVFNAMLELYRQVYQGELFDDALSFASVFASLLYGTVEALLSLFFEILGSGAWELLDAIAEAHRQEVVCASMDILAGSGTLEDVREYQISQFSDWTPVPLSLIRGRILPLAEHMFSPGHVCDCEEQACTVLLGTMGEGGCEDWIDSVWNEYHEAHTISICYGPELNFLFYHEGWTNTGYTDMYWCSGVVECPDEWSAGFEINLNMTYPDLPASPFEHSDTSYFMFFSATSWRLRAVVTG